MSWDWDAEDIDPDKNDRWIWVPITPKTLDEEALWAVEAKPETFKVEEQLPTSGSKPHWVMSMYAVTNRPGGVRHATMPVCQVVGTPIMGPKANVHAPSEWSGISGSSMGMEDPQVKQAAPLQPKVNTSQTAEGKIWVAKNAPIVMSDTLRDVPCDRCEKVGRLCLPWTKGGQALTTCARCYGLKMSC